MNENIKMILLFSLFQFISFLTSEGARLENKTINEININRNSVVTSAEIIECNTIIRSRDCRTTYRYTVSFNTFINLEILPCNECIIGENIMIKYLATNPAISIIEGHKGYVKQMFYSFLFLIMPWYFIMGPILYKFNFYILKKLKLLDSL